MVSCKSSLHWLFISGSDTLEGTQGTAREPLEWWLEANLTKDFCQNHSNFCQFWPIFENFSLFVIYYFYCCDTPCPEGLIFKVLFVCKIFTVENGIKPNLDLKTIFYLFCTLFSYSIQQFRIFWKFPPSLIYKCSITDQKLRDLWSPLNQSNQQWFPHLANHTKSNQISLKWP